MHTHKTFSIIFEGYPLIKTVPFLPAGYAPTFSVHKVDPYAQVQQKQTDKRKPTLLLKKDQAILIGIQGWFIGSVRNLI